jgi:hypothetical protein
LLVVLHDETAKSPTIAPKGVRMTFVHRTALETDSRERGAMALKGALDFEFRVEKVGHNLKLINTKMKDAEAPKDMFFSFRQVELVGNANSAVLDSTEAPERELRLTPTQRLAQATYESAAVKSGIWDDGAFRGVHLDEWRVYFYAKHTGDTADAKRKAFQRVRKDMTENGRMTAENNVYLILDGAIQTKIMLRRDKRDMAGQNEKCPGAEAENSGTSGTCV